MTNELVERLNKLETADKARREKAKAVTKAWRLRHPDWQKNYQAARRKELEDLRAEYAAHLRKGTP